MHTRMLTHRHTSTYLYIPLRHNQLAPPTGAKRQKDKMSVNPDLAPRGASRLITVVKATLGGVFQVSLVMEKVHPPPTVSLNMDCSVWLRSHYSWRPPFTNHARVTEAGSESPAGERSAPSPTREIRALSPPITLIDFARTSEARGRARQKESKGPSPPPEPPGLETFLRVTRRSCVSVSRLLAAITYAASQ